MSVIPADTGKGAITDVETGTGTGAGGGGAVEEGPIFEGAGGGTVPIAAACCAFFAWMAAADD